MARKEKTLFSFMKREAKKAPKPAPEPRPVKPPKPVKPPRVKKVKPEKAKDVDPVEATAWRYAQLRSLGIEVEWIEGWRAIKAIKRLRLREPIEDVALSMEIKNWTRVEVSKGQKGMMWHKGIPDWLARECRCKRDAGLLISAKLEAPKLRKLILADLARCRDNDDVTAIGIDLKFLRGVLDPEIWDELVAAGKARREQIVGGIPE